MKYPAWGSIFGLITKCTKDNGKEIKCMGRELSFGVMVRVTKASL
jgi:hypothetical protein